MLTPRHITEHRTLQKRGSVHVHVDVHVDMSEKGQNAWSEKFQKKKTVCKRIREHER